MGLGVGTIHFPHYRGSNEYETWVLPAPYAVYRGDLLKADERNVRGRFFKSERIELELSVFGAPPAKGNDARNGMPDLDFTLELGPSLNVELYRSEDKRQNLELRLPVRGVVATDFHHLDSAGWIFQPNLYFESRNLLDGWKVGLFSSVIYTDRNYNRYFYAVDPEFATPQRPAYSIGGGYGGPQFIASLSRRFPQFWLGGFVKWDSVANAVFTDSPLVTAKRNFSSGLAFAWIFQESAEKVDVAKQ
jgi:outer membrane scaffolding protein for murein synthesis (MipA/OmpV family)